MSTATNSPASQDLEKSPSRFSSGCPSPAETIVAIEAPKEVYPPKRRQYIVLFILTLSYFIDGGFLLWSLADSSALLVRLHRVRGAYHKVSQRGV